MFFSCVLFLLPWPLLLSLCLCVNLLLLCYLRFLQSSPSCVCPLVSPGDMKCGQAVPGSLSPMGSYACVGLFRLRSTLLKPAVGEGLQFVGVRKCSHSPIIWWSPFISSSSVLRNILHPKSCSARRAIFGPAWAPRRGCRQPFPAALLSPTGLSCLPSPCSGPLRAQCGGHLLCPCPGDVGNGTKNKGKTTEGRTPPVGPFAGIFLVPCLFTL